MPANHELTHGTVVPPSGSQTRAVYTGNIQWVWCPATLVKTVKVRRGLHDHVGSDRRLVVGQVTPCFGVSVIVPRLKELLELGVTNQQLVAIDWFTGGSCVVFPGENTKSS